VRLSLYLKLISSQLGVWMLHLYGMSAYREGNVIDLGFTQLQVVDACSGLRYLFPLMVLALILAYWFKDRFRRGSGGGLNCLTYLITCITIR
jgi:exosortase